jgi:hypothetical protein
MCKNVLVCLSKDLRHKSVGLFFFGEIVAWCYNLLPSLRHSQIFDRKLFLRLRLIRKNMDVNECERLSNITLRHRLK